MITATGVDGFDAVYSSLPQALGLQVGMVRQEPNSPNFKMLVRFDPAAVASLPVNAAARFKATFADSFVVLATTALTDQILGSNDNSGVVIPAGSFFWASVGGFLTILGAANIAEGFVVAATAVAGVVDEVAQVTATPAQQTNIVSTGVTVGAAAVQCYKQGF